MSEIILNKQKRLRRCRGVKKVKYSAGKGLGCRLYRSLELQEYVYSKLRPIYS